MKGIQYVSVQYGTVQWSGIERVNELEKETKQGLKSDTRPGMMCTEKHE